MEDCPKYLNCPWCNAQAFPKKSQTRLDTLVYECPASHCFLIWMEDPSFNYGHNKKEEKENV